MEIEQAREIITQLANGVDPTTGEVFPNESPYNHPDIIRALFTILRTSRSITKPSKKTIEEKQQENIDNGRPRNAGLPWTDELKDEINFMFNDGETIDELSLHFERTKGSIISELTHQGLIEESEPGC